MARARTKTTKVTSKTRTAAKQRCGLCGRSGRLYRTDCCGNWICEDEHTYQMFSFATNSCSRNHRRYTVCASHHAEGHEGPDWRACDECRVCHDKLEMYVWAATNEFNFVKLENPPAYEPTRCAKCQKVIHLGTEGYAIKGGDYICQGCYPMPGVKP